MCSFSPPRFHFHLPLPETDGRRTKCGLPAKTHSELNIHHSSRGTKTLMATVMVTVSLLFVAVVVEASTSSFSISTSFIKLRAFHLSHRRHHQQYIGHERYYCCFPRSDFLQAQLRHNEDEVDDNNNYYDGYQVENSDECNQIVNDDDDEEDHSEALSTTSKTRFRARAAYCGTAYSGWQAQRRRRQQQQQAPQQQHQQQNHDKRNDKERPTTTTIQGEIEQALSTRFHRNIPVVGASRTDAGVHARGQAFHFDLLSSELPPVGVTSTSSPPFESGEGVEDIRQQSFFDVDEFCSKLQHSMNRMLPLDIRIFNLQLAPSTSAVKITTNYSTKLTSPTMSSSSLSSSSSSSSSSSRPWHAIQAAKAKWYSYRFTLGPTLRNPMDRYTRTHFVHRPSFAHRHRVSSSSSSTATTAIIEQQLDHQHQYLHSCALTKLDMDRLQYILKLFEGTHDFRAFGGQLEQNEKKRKVKITDKKFDTVRTVYKVELIKEEEVEEDLNGVADDTDFFLGEEGNYRIDFLLQGALYKMVRNMVGTAMECWLGRISEDQVVTLLAQNSNNIHGPWNKNDDYANNGHNNRQFQRRDNPCKPAPPEGLTLECVYYDDGF